MALLRATLAGALAAGCYSPTLPDCTVACANDADCAPSQTCGGDGMCASPERAGRCIGASLDAALDARVPDAGVPDAPRCRFAVTIEGKGRVVIDGLVECKHKEGTCAFDLPVLPHDVIAIAERDWMFERWTSVACAAQDDACYLASCTSTTLIGVSFVHDD
ncbi:MAG TPA: hypothetical protein VM513_21375 [Kofleriaceae bacterium]|nr:hypothetical protein [Kofleriaceae bacterium]